MAERLPPFIELFQVALAPALEGAPHSLTPAQLTAGSVALARSLHQIADDMPKAPELVGSQMFAPLVAQQAIKLDLVLSSVLKVPPMEEGAEAPLVEADMAEALVYGIMLRRVVEVLYDLMDDLRG